MLELPAIVGRTYRRTPVFSEEIGYLVFSPYWHVPPGIARNDILPAVKKNPTYLEEKQIRVFEGSGTDVREVAPRNIDWKVISASALPYRFRQDPGPGNALGPIKFMFPNRFNVYLHGTPTQELLDEDVRSLSSGCIRVARPLELAAYLLADDPTWNEQRIQKAAVRGQEQTVHLKQRIPIHILYWTAWVESDEVVHFRRDPYERDEALRKALQDKPPQPAP